MNIPGYDAWKLATPPQYEPTEREEHLMEPCPPESRCAICWPEIPPDFEYEATHERVKP